MVNASNNLLNNLLNNYLKPLFNYLEARFLKSKSKIFLSTLVSFIIGAAIYLWRRPELIFNITTLTIVITSALMILIAIVWRKDIWVRFSALVLAFLFFGFIFTLAYFHYFLSPPFAFDKKEVSFVGYVCNNPQIEIEDVKYELCLWQMNDETASFKILITADLYPRYDYGEVITGEGTLEKPGIINGFDYQSYLLTKKIFGVMYKPKIDSSKQKTESNEQQTAGSRLKGALFKVKNKLEATISQIMPEPEASFMNGLILGERSNLSPELVNDFNRTGTTHIIALSGYNITIIIMAVNIAFGYLGKKRAFLISLILTLFFVIMTGASASVVRASIMVSLVLAAPLLGRRAKSINILVLTAAVMLLFNPLILRYDLGFALSFLSISGLVLLSPILIKKFAKGRLAKTPAEIKSPLIETLSAQTFAFPLILYSFSRVSLIAPLTNVLILPFIPLTMAMGFAVGFIGMISKSLAEILAYFPFFFLKYMIMVVRFFSKLPLASIEINKFPVVITIFLYLLIIITTSILNRRIMVKDGIAVR